MTNKNVFSESDRKALEPSEKIGLIATVTPEGLPHVSLLTSIMAPAQATLTVGEFCKGRSKEYMRDTKKTGFAVLTLDKRLWRGKALWTHLEKEGPEYEVYNQQPMFRYNTYFGINTVHYLDLQETSEGASLPLAAIAGSALLTRAARGGAVQSRAGRVLTHFGESLLNRLDALKFLSYIAEDGYPVIIPVIQAQAAGDNRLVFHPGAFSADLKGLQSGVATAVFGLTMQMEDILVRGIFKGYSRFRGIKLGILDIDWVYNSMPPNHGQIYPPLPLTAVVNF